MIEELRAKLMAEAEALNHELQVTLPSTLEKALEHGDLRENADYQVADFEVEQWPLGLWFECIMDSVDHFPIRVNQRRVRYRTLPLRIHGIEELVPTFCLEDEVRGRTVLLLQDALGKPVPSALLNAGDFPMEAARE